STFSFSLDESYSNSSYEITNQLGEIQKCGIVKSGKNEASLNDLPNGIYFMKINALNLSIQKIIKL
ncbi:MAG: T9SS type A sorting domain-containing protein, partial [Fluviicola sp.]